MKGNIGPSKKSYYFNQDNIDNKQKRLFSKMADEFDIDKVIPKDH